MSGCVPQHDDGWKGDHSGALAEIAVRQRYDITYGISGRSGPRSSILKHLLSEEEEKAMESARAKYAERTAHGAIAQSTRWRNFVLNCPKTFHASTCDGCTASDCTHQQWFGMLTPEMRLKYAESIRNQMNQKRIRLKRGVREAGGADNNARSKRHERPPYTSTSQLPDVITHMMAIVDQHVDASDTAVKIDQNMAEFAARRDQILQFFDRRMAELLAKRTAAANGLADVALANAAIERALAEQQA
jgi:hypothetical protein